jgi:hypothetical protein
MPISYGKIVQIKHNGTKKINLNSLSYDDLFYRFYSLSSELHKIIKVLDSNENFPVSLL